MYPESGDKPSTLPEVSNIYPTVLYYPRGKRQETSGEDGEVSRGRGEERDERRNKRTIWCFWCSRSRCWCEQIGDGSGACGVTNVAEVLGNKWV